MLEKARLLKLPMPPASTEPWRFCPRCGSSDDGDWGCTDSFHAKGSASPVLPPREEQQTAVREAFKAGFLANIKSDSAAKAVLKEKDYEWTFHAQEFHSELEPQAWRAYVAVLGAAPPAPKE